MFVPLPLVLANYSRYILKHSVLQDPVCDIDISVFVVCFLISLVGLDHEGTEA